MIDCNQTTAYKQVSEKTIVPVEQRDWKQSIYIYIYFVFVEYMFFSPFSPLSIFKLYLKCFSTNNSLPYSNYVLIAKHSRVLPDTWLCIYVHIVTRSASNRCGSRMNSASAEWVVEVASYCYLVAYCKCALLSTVQCTHSLAWRVNTHTHTQECSRPGYYLLEHWISSRG